METIDCSVKESEQLSSLKQFIDNADNHAILIEIISKCKEEMENNCLSKPLDDYVERIAFYTGLPKMLLSKELAQYGKKTDYEDNHFELCDHIKIMEIISQLYILKQSSTYMDVFKLYKNANNTFYEFYHKMNSLGFRYHKTKSGIDILIEDPAFTFERYLYLKQIEEFRSKGASIYYIDERFFDSKLTFPKVSFIKNEIDVSSETCNGYVFFCAISKNGFFNGLFSSPTTPMDFVKWISHILIPKFAGQSVIVMDNNELHGSVINSITKYDSKEEMLKYLRQRNIPCNENWHKAELYDLINKCTVKHARYDVDEIFKAHGHRVLRLPSTFQDLSLTHFLWKHYHDFGPNVFKEYNLPFVKAGVIEWLSNIQQKMWDSFHEELIKTEKNISSIDKKTAASLEPHLAISST